MDKILSLTCPSCGGKLNQLTITRFQCAYCGNDHFISLEEPKEEIAEDGPTWEDKRLADEYRYQQILTTKYFPLEKKVKEIGQLNMIGFAAMVFFFPSAIFIWGYNAFQAFMLLREPRFTGDDDLRAKIETQFWLALIMALAFAGLILLMVFLNISRSIIDVLI